ncbi:MAG: substrate-binding domain-containing protein [Propionibacteriaceae bacterium]|nr:substrate-binding domain-containing protein [Propionibacteriaceae bacterium]
MKRPVATYILVSLIVGFLAVPVAVSVVWLLASIAGSMGDLTQEWVAVVLVAFVVSGLLAVPLGRWSRRPSTWRGALLPVVVPPVYYLAAWVVAFGVTGLAYGDTLPVAAFTHAPYALVLLWVQLTAAPVLLPATLVAVLLGTLVGFVLGCLRRPANGRGWLVAVLVAALLIAGVGVGQVVQAAVNSRVLDNGATVSTEVDLNRYRPFEPGNALVVPVRKPTLSIATDHPVLDGATAAFPIYAAMGQAIYQLPDGSTAEDRGEFVDRYLACSNTREGYAKLVDGTVDVFFGAQPSQAQQQAAKGAGRKLTLTPIGREAFVVFVNQDNPVSGLTTAQIRDIYTRKLTNWSQLGGRDEAILAFQRPEGSGSQTVMESKVMQGQQLASPLKEETVEGMGGILSKVADYRNSSAAIGYSFRWYATVMNGNPGIKLLAVDGVEPTPENIRNGTYPFTVDVYAVTAGTTNPNAKKLVDWVVSDEGQSLIEQVGYVGLR